MAKKKIEVTEGNSIIASWVKTNEEKLAEVEQVNPDLFTAMQSALNYLNSYLGGTEQIKIDLTTKGITVEALNVLPITETLPPPFPYTQYRVKTEKELRKFYDPETYPQNKSRFESLLPLAGRKLVTFIDDLQDLNSLIKAPTATAGLSPIILSNVPQGLYPNDVTERPLKPKGTVDNQTRELIGKAEKVCDIAEKKGVAFNDLYGDSALSEQFIKEMLLHHSELRALININFSEADYYYIFTFSPMLWWILLYTKSYSNQSQFLEMWFTDVSGTIYTVDGIIFNGSTVEFYINLKPDGIGASERYRFSNNEAVKALLGVTFHAYRQDDDKILILQAVKLPKTQPFPFIIGDTVELIKNDGLKASLGAQAKVADIQIYDFGIWDVNFSGLMTLITVVWTTADSNGESNDGYAPDLFRNLTRPQKSWQKSDFFGKMVVVTSNAEARAFQKLVLGLGIRWADGDDEVQLTRYRAFEITDLGQMNAERSDAKIKYANNKIFFDDLGIAPIKEVLTAKEIESSSIFVSNKEELTYLQEILENKFGLNSYGTQVLPRNSVFYVKINETDFRILATPQARVLYNLSELGRDPIYKSPDNSTGIKFTSGDRFIYDDSYVYNKPEQGFLTYRLNITDEFSTPAVQISFADNSEGTRNVNWIYDTDPDTVEVFRQKAMDGDIRILSKRPLFEEDTTVGNYEILQVGFVKNDVGEGYDFLYQAYRKDTNTFLSISETNLVKLQMPEVPTTSIDPTTTNIKIEVKNEAEATAFQKWAFSKGVEWGYIGTKLINLDQIYFVIEDGRLNYYDVDDKYSQSSFRDNPTRLVTLDELGIVVPQTSKRGKIDPTTTDIKIEVKNEDEARLFQEWLFSQGVEWSITPKNIVKFAEQPYFNVENGVLYFWDSNQKNEFDEDTAELVTLEDLGINVSSQTAGALTTPIINKALWGQSAEIKDPKLKIDFVEALKIIDKKRRINEDKVKLTLFLSNVYFVERGTAEYDVMDKEYRNDPSDPSTNRIYRVEPKRESIEDGLEIESIVQRSDLQLEDWILSIAWNDILYNITDENDKEKVKKKILNRAVKEMGQAEVDRMLSETKSPTASVKTSKQTVQTPEPKIEVTNLYNELDDLDI